ncbi:MAG: TldD/PmbA family protein [Acidimicrobiia bacterium]
MDLLQIAQGVAAAARDGEQIEAYVARSRDTEVRVFDGEVESLSSAESEGIGVRVIAAGRQGFAYAGSLEPDAVAEALAEARDNAAFGTTDEHAGLAEPDGVPAPDLDLWREELARFPTDQKVALAVELDRLTRGADPRIRTLEATDYGDSMLETAVATSTGLAALTRRTVCSVFVEAIAGESTASQTGYGYSVARRPEDLDLERAARDAAVRATRLLGARQPASQRLTVVLEPRMTAQLLGVLGAALSGEAVLKGRSMFAGREGETVAVGAFTLVDDPTIPEAYGATPFDAEGLATRRNVLVDRGVLAGFLHNAYTGRRAGTGSTASAVRPGFKGTPSAGARALVPVPGDADQADLLAAVGEGLLVQTMQGLHSGTNPVSGDFSVGVEGLMVRGGELAEPVREATIASTLQRILQDIVAVGGDLEWFPGNAAGVTLVIRDVTISGT